MVLTRMHTLANTPRGTCERVICINSHLHFWRCIYAPRIAAIDNRKESRALHERGKSDGTSTAQQQQHQHARQHHPTHSCRARPVAHIYDIYFLSVYHRARALDNYVRVCDRACARSVFMIFIFFFISLRGRSA